MSPTMSTFRRRRSLVGVVLATCLALGTAVVANGASRDAGAVPSTGSSSTRSSSVGADCASMGGVVVAAVAATSDTGTGGAVHAARARAFSVARATGSDDVRELAQNLADDLAAYSVALTTQSSQRRTDIRASVHGDVAALRLFCGRQSR